MTSTVSTATGSSVASISAGYPGLSASLAESPAGVLSVPSLLNRVDPAQGKSSRIVIPARLASTRLPEKLLLRETGKTVLQHTFESASAATRPSGIIVAVDSPRLAREVEGFGGLAVLTDPDLPSGTDRVAEVARQFPEIDVFINVQGDEPEIAGAAIDLVADLLERHPRADVATLAAPIRDRHRLEDPSCVKVVCDHQQRALYFSRSPIPHARSWEDQLLNCDPPTFLQHIGIYGYRREFLLKLAELPPSPLEQLEKLEQLRFLQAGCEIVVGQVSAPTQGIDTWNDYRAFVRRRCGC
jgi:3-deoxy-manno-octulosonate cytidylyltransferase (CMP-KDO synthetase)